MTGAAGNIAADGASDQEPGTSGAGKSDTANPDKSEPSTSVVAGECNRS